MYLCHSHQVKSIRENLRERCLELLSKHDEALAKLPDHEADAKMESLMTQLERQLMPIRTGSTDACLE